jgi:hypothetical protein
MREIRIHDAPPASSARIPCLDSPGARIQNGGRFPSSRLHGGDVVNKAPIVLLLSALICPAAVRAANEKSPEPVKTAPQGATAPAAPMTIWQARKIIAGKLPQVRSHREMRVGIGIYDERDVTISAARVRGFTVEYDYRASWNARGRSCKSPEDCGKSAGLNSVDLKTTASIAVVKNGWRRTRRGESAAVDTGWSWRSCQGYCLAAGGDYVSADFMWASDADAQAVADAMNFLRAYARGDWQASESPSPDFSQKASVWRALTPRPPLPEEVRQHRLIAENAVRQKDFDTAVDEYEAGLAAYPVWPEGHFNAALLSAEMGYYPEAIGHMRCYVELVPAAADAQAARDQIVIWQAQRKR